MILETFFPRAATVQTLGHPAAGVLGWFGGSASASGISVTEDNAYDYSPVFAATRLISSGAGNLPVRLMRGGRDRKMRSGGKTAAKDHPVFRLVYDAPNPMMTASRLRVAGIIQQVNAGNAYAEIERDGSGTPVALWPIHQSRVRVVREGQELYYVVRMESGLSVALPKDDVLHVPSPICLDGVSGIGIIQHARETIGAGLAAERHAGSTFANGAVPRTVLMHPKTMEPKARANLREEWQQMYGGSQNAGKTAVLWEDMDLKVLSVSNEDAQFISVRGFNVTEIARWYGVPPHMIQDLGHATFCLPGDAMVSTENGPKPIKDIAVGEMVWSRDGDRWVLAPVEKSACTGVDEILEIRCGLRKLRCNARHRVPVRRRVLTPFSGGRGSCVVVDGERFRWRQETIWVDAGDIRPGDQLLAANGFGDSKRTSCPTRECSERFMEALGMIVGDGFFARTGKLKYKTCFGISHGENDSYLPHYVEAIESEFRACSGPYGLRRGGTVALKAKRRDKNTTVFNSSLAYQEMELLGIAGTAKTKRVPEWVFGLADNLKLAFLRGYLDSDGTVSKEGAIRYVSVNRVLLEQVRHLCISVGVRCSNIAQAEISSEFNGKEYHHTLYTLICTSAEDNLRIGTYTDFYQERMSSKALRKASRRVNPVEKVDGILFSTVEEIRTLPAEPVYDLAVAGTHTFVADGVLVHNSNIEHQGRSFVQLSLMPIILPWEEEMDRKLLTQKERDEGYYIYFDVDEWQRGDSQGRAQANQIKFMNGVINQDEWRAEEDDDPLPNGLGQKFYVPANLITVEKAGQPPEPAAPAGFAQAPAETDEEDDAEEPDEPTEDARLAPARERAIACLRDRLAHMLRVEGNAAERAAGKPGKFLAAVEEFYAGHEVKLAEAIAPLVELVNTLHGTSHVAAAIAKEHCERAKASLLVAAEVPADKLPESVAAAMAELAEKAFDPSQERDELGQFTDGGGGGGGSSDDDDDEPDDDRERAHEEEDAKRQESRDQEDEDREEADAKEDEARNEARTAQESEREARHQEEDADLAEKFDTEEEGLTNDIDEREASESQARTEARTKEDAASTLSRDQEDTARESRQADEVIELQGRQQAELDSFDARESELDSALDDAETDEEREALEKSQAAERKAIDKERSAAEKRHAKEEAALNKQHDKEAADVERQRDKEDAAMSKQRDKEDEAAEDSFEDERQARRDDFEQRKATAEKELAKRQRDEDAEAAKRNKEEDKKIAADRKQRDAEIKRRREQEDSEIQRRRDAERKGAA